MAEAGRAHRPRASALAVLLGATLAAGGCVVASATAGAAISVTGAVVTTGVSLTGKAIGAGIDALTGPSEPDHSGLVVRERIAPAGPPTSPCDAGAACQ